MATLIDSSAFYAYFDGDDRYHERAKRAMDRFGPSDPLVTHNYVLAETADLLRRRLGAAAVRDLADAARPIGVFWVEPPVHEEALAAMIASGSRSVSIVDRVSFIVMRRMGIKKVFCFDSDFADEGFELVG